MKLHQLTTVTPGTVTYSDVSCLCDLTSNCSCFNAKNFSFPSNEINLALRSSSSTELEIHIQVCNNESVDQSHAAEDGCTSIVSIQRAVLCNDNGLQEHQVLVLIDNLDGLVGEWCVVRTTPR